MGNPYPVHSCTVGPFESYYSNVVSRLTRIVSRNIDCNLSSDKIDVSIASDYELTLSNGSVIKDDVLVQIESITIDFTDRDYYYHGLTWNQIGYYYVLLYYVYEKARPAPQPKIQILRPDQKGSYTPGGAFVLIKVAEVELVGTELKITEILDYDRDLPDNRRIFSSPYLGLEPFLPTFDYDRDNGRLIKTTDITDDGLYYGGESAWFRIPSITWIEEGFVDLETELTNLRTYVGASGPTDIDPNYDSIRHIVQSSNLTTAISTLDLSLGYSSLKKDISDNSSTPSILATSGPATGKICGVLNLLNTVPTAITDLLDGPAPTVNECVMVILRFGNSNTSVIHSGAINLIGATDLTGLVGGDMLVLVRHYGIWNELLRSLASESGLFHIDHDSLGHHKEGAWHIGSGLVSSTVSAANLVKLTDGSSLDYGELHKHGNGINVGGNIVFITPTYVLGITGPVGWTALDLSGIVPAGTIAVICNGYTNPQSANQAGFFEVKAWNSGINGVPPNAALYGVHGLYGTHSVWVQWWSHGSGTLITQVDSNRVIGYRITGSMTCYLSVIAYII